MTFCTRFHRLFCLTKKSCRTLHKQSVHQRGEKPIIRLLTYISLTVFLASASISAQVPESNPVDKRIRNGGFGVRAGAIAPSTWSVADDDFGTTMSVGMGAFIETAVTQGLSLRFATDIHNIASSLLRDQELLFTFLVGPRWSLDQRNPGLVVRPGFSLGIGYIGNVGTALERDSTILDGTFVPNYREVDRINSTAYLAYSVEVEVMFLNRRNQNFATFVDFGLLGAASGGNSDVDASFRPTVTMHVGVMY